MSGNEDAWLAVIDMQRVFAEADSPWLTPRFAATIEPIQALVAAFGVRVTRFIAPAVPDGAWRGYYEQWPFALQPPDARIYELVDDFAPARILDATMFGKWGPELAGHIGARRLVLAGVSTDCCVLSTALAAADAGVPWVTDESHEQALAVMALYGPLIEIIRAADLTG
jgi:nicotinamidase-related amidase